MGERLRSEGSDKAPAARSNPAAPERPAALPQRPGAAGALALQRSIGNRATTQVLQRWAAHPDKDKKGVLMPDAMAAEFQRFNPPLSK
jgi:hypothetical protein